MIIDRKQRQLRWLLREWKRAKDKKFPTGRRNGQSGNLDFIYCARALQVVTDLLSQPQAQFVLCEWWVVGSGMPSANRTAVFAQLESAAGQHCSPMQIILSSEGQALDMTRRFGITVARWRSVIGYPTPLHSLGNALPLGAFLLALNPCWHSSPYRRGRMFVGERAIARWRRAVPLSREKLRTLLED